MSNFGIGDDEAVLTSSYITTGGKPILKVIHQFDEDDGEDFWQFHCGNDDYAQEVLKLVRLSTLLALDSTLGGISNLPRGHIATRVAVGEEWMFEPE